MNLRRLFVTCTLGLAMVIASTAFAQGADDAKSGRRNKPRPATDADPMLEENTDPGVLAGPTVEDEASQGSNNPMNSPNNPNRRRAASDQNIPLRQWLEVVRNVGLSEEQRQQVELIAVEFQTAQRDFQTEHGNELQQLQRQVRAARESGKEPDPALREKMQLLEAAMPKQIEYQKRIWETLSMEQQALARTKLADLEKKLQEQRRRNAAGGGGAGAARGAGAPSAQTPSEQPQRPQQTTPRGRATARPATDTDAGGEMLSPSGQPERANPQPVTTDPDDGMTGTGMAAPPEKAAPAAAQTPAAPARERAAAARRRGGSDAAINMSELDAPARSRVQFLLAHLSQGRAGNAPTADEKNFRFVEDK